MIACSLNSASSPIDADLGFSHVASVHGTQSDVILNHICCKFLRKVSGLVFWWAAWRGGARGQVFPGMTGWPPPPRLFTRRLETRRPPNLTEEKRVKIERSPAEICDVFDGTKSGCDYCRPFIHTKISNLPCVRRSYFFVQNRKVTDWQLPSFLEIVWYKDSYCIPF